MGFIRYLIIAILIFFFISRLRKMFAVMKSREGFDSRDEARKEFQDSPYEILEVDRSATQEDIRIAYKKLMNQYHPDKVNHLGPELQKVAREKTELINWAFEQLEKK